MDDRSANGVFEEYRAACAAEAGVLWGTSLFGPLLIADPSTWTGFVNVPVPGCGATRFDGVHRTVLPPELGLANTALEWEGTRWTVVCWPLPVRAEDRSALLIHEAFHRLQPDLGVHGRTPVVAHLDEVRWRTSMRLELRALADALRRPSSGERAAAIASAVAIRAERHRHVADGGRDEDDLERSEGTAEYTGRRVAHRDPADAVATILDAVGSGTPMVRNFAYFTGPAYGLLLDDIRPGWRGQLVDGATITQLAREVTDWAAVDVASAARRYGQSVVAAEERERARELDLARIAWTQLLVDGPTARLSVNHLNKVFNPAELVPLEGIGIVHPTARITDDWGELVVEHGALIDTAERTVMVSARGMRRHGMEASGHEWHLRLTDGWGIERRHGGDFEVLRLGLQPPPDGAPM